jgi:predicted nucleotidyltransferase
MVRPARFADAIEVVYDEQRWKLLSELRGKAKEIMKALARANIESLVHGSVARGDVDKNSDIDIFIPYPLPSYSVELALADLDIQAIRREIVMATPKQLPKAHIFFDGNRSVTFPLVRPRKLELEFYFFGGAINIKQIEKGIRSSGVDKRLMLIEPTPDGHVESPVVGREAEVAKRLCVDMDIVRERVKVLTRRVAVGHTGVFVQRMLGPNESFEEVFKKIAETNPAVKSRIKER